MRIPISIGVDLENEEDIQGMLDALTVSSMRQIATRPGPRLYKSGVRYRREPRRTGNMRERWQTRDETMEVGHGDCEDLGAWRAAELRLDGERARAIPVRVPGIGWHIVVERESGRREDPSARLGMRGRA